VRLPHGAGALVWGALAAVAFAIGTSACGDDDQPGATAATSTSTSVEAATSASTPTASTAAPASSPTASAAAPTASTAEESGAADGSSGANGSTTTTAAPSGDALAAATAYETVFDSATALEAKANDLPDAQALASTIEAYAATGARMGGIRMEVTAVAIAGDEATATYDVLFGGKPAYQQLTGTLQRAGDGWAVSRTEFCSFMSSARTPCT
jgi:hypothetical protein